MPLQGGQIEFKAHRKSKAGAVAAQLQGAVQAAGGAGSQHGVETTKAKGTPGASRAGWPSPSSSCSSEEGDEETGKLGGSRAREKDEEKKDEEEKMVGNEGEDQGQGQEAASISVRLDLCSPVNAASTRSLAGSGGCNQRSP
jgi:hypothetical protein